MCFRKKGTVGNKSHDFTYSSAYATLGHSEMLLEKFLKIVWWLSSILPVYLVYAR